MKSVSPHTTCYTLCLYFKKKKKVKEKKIQKLLSIVEKSENLLKNCFVFILTTLSDKQSWNCQVKMGSGV